MKLDRTAFKTLSLKEQGNDKEYWLSKTVLERLSASWYLTCCAYDLPFSSNHKIDRTAFRMGKLGEK